MLHALHGSDWYSTCIVADPNLATLGVPPASSCSSSESSVSAWVAGHFLDHSRAPHELVAIAGHRSSQSNATNEFDRIWLYSGPDPGTAQSAQLENGTHGTLLILATGESPIMQASPTMY